MDIELDDINFELDGVKLDEEDEMPEITTKQAVKAKSTFTKREFRKLKSEAHLLDILPYNVEYGNSYHCLSFGDVDSLSYLKYIIRQQPLRYLLFSTWCMAKDDIKQIQQWINRSRLNRVDAYIGEIFRGSYANEYRMLLPIINATGGRVAIFRNHAKVMAGIGDKFAFAIESSANINTNPRTENTVITIDKDLFMWYKNTFDRIQAFNKDENKGWEPWHQ